MNQLLSGAKSLPDILRQRAAIQPDDVAYIYLADGNTDARTLTWKQLDARARVLAEELIKSGARGRPVLLALPSGLNFVEALFGCWYARGIAVPLSLPRHRRVKHRLGQLVADAGAHCAISTPDIRERLDIGAIENAALSKLTWIDASEATSKTPDPLESRDLLESGGDEVALLQYTSGSTGNPRGVMVSHHNLLHNSAVIAQACGHKPGDTIAGWLPLFHDMGLVGLLQAAYSGARCVFMSPERFLMRPRLWLQMMSNYRACSSPAPNFAYDLCVEKIEPAERAGLDLSHWRNALNGSEPIRVATLARFGEAFAQYGFGPYTNFPCYGLAESTLFVTGPGSDRRLVRRNADGKLLSEADEGGYVGCGRATNDTKVSIVDPKSSRVVAAGQIGEIWVCSPSVALGYWNNPEATAQTFNATIAGEVVGVSASDRWLRTGDLGFVMDDQLFITGRLRDLIIIAGRNLFPTDLERTAEAADPAIQSSGVAAFSVDVDGIERLVIVAEIRREAKRNVHVPELDLAAIQRRIAAAIAAEHEVAVHEVRLLNAGSLPRTTSGKLRRASTREAYLNDTLELAETGKYADSIA